jgi:hypothetical protein
MMSKLKAVFGVKLSGCTVNFPLPPIIIEPIQPRDEVCESRPQLVRLNKSRMDIRRKRPLDIGLEFVRRQKPNLMFSAELLNPIPADTRLRTAPGPAGKS